MSLYNRAAYLQQILNNPKTSTQEYLRAQHELNHMYAEQLRVNAAADAYHKNNDKLTGGQNV